MKPLTIEELKALPLGEWVWVVDIESPKHGSGYWQIHGFAKTHIHFNQESAISIMPETLYGKDWLAWKNKEQAEAKGEIVELPCKQGDTVWVVYQDDETFEECITESIAIEFVVMRGYTGIHVPKVYGRYQEVYVTREQAEARLAELKGGK